MENRFPPEAEPILKARFHGDALIALATVAEGVPHVRTVNAMYRAGAFYVITYALSGKMRQIARNPAVAVCGEWFTGHGLAESLGWLGAPENAELRRALRETFAAWIDNGHVDEADPNTCILRIRLTDGVLMAEGRRYAGRFD